MSRSNDVIIFVGGKDSNVFLIAVVPVVSIKTKPKVGGQSEPITEPVCNLKGSMTPSGLQELAAEAKTTLNGYHVTGICNGAQLERITGLLQPVKKKKKKIQMFLSGFFRTHVENAF